MTTNKITSAKVLRILLNYINNFQYDRAVASEQGDFNRSQTCMNMACAVYGILVDLGFEDGVHFEKRITSRDGVEYMERIPIKGGRK